MHSADGYADYIENLYYLHQYWTGSSSRDVIPPLFDNSIFNPLKDIVGWNGYWYQNTREIYWSTLPAGHADLWKPFFDLYLRRAAEGPGVGQDAWRQRRGRRGIE